MDYSYIIADIAGLTYQSAAYCQPYGGHMGWRMCEYGLGGVLVWIVFIALIVIIVYSFLKFAAPAKNTTEQSGSLEILKKRYARGEITRDEFLQMKKDLE